ncbi:MAG: winged helix-turn-helix domain-containing protein [Cyanobacteriota bacterium]|nr:winged helix-turn-helix domain-containing protein [Cyanobacteriota bacterium]
MTHSQIQSNARTSWTFGPYSLDGEGNLRIGPTAIHLPPLQRRLLLALARQQGQVLSRETLLEEVWGHDQVSEVSISRTVHGLRRAFTDGPLGSSVIRTIYGGGYRLDVPVRVAVEAAAEAGALKPSGLPSAQTLSVFVEGMVWVRRRDPRLLPRAEQHLRRCLDIAPDFSPALVALVATRLARYQWGLLSAQGIENELEVLLQRAELSGDLAAEVLALRVEVLSLLHWQPDLAEGRFARWLPSQLPEGAPLHSWARHLIATGRASAARPLLEPHLNADNPDGWLLTAVACWLTGDHGSAIRHLREQLAIDGSLAGARLVLSLVLADGDQPEQALHELEATAISSDPVNGLQALAALILALCGQTARAQTHLRQGIDDGGRSKEMISLWGLTALVLGEDALAANLLDQAVHHRCGLAPFVRHLPSLSRFEDSPALARFQEAMKNRFRCTF